MFFGFDRRSRGKMYVHMSGTNLSKALNLQSFSHIFLFNIRSLKYFILLYQ